VTAGAQPFPSKPDAIAAALRDLIASGVLEPGTVLRQRALAERFGVSTTPVREALRQLEAEGAVRRRPYSGATVAPAPAPYAQSGPTMSSGRIGSRESSRPHAARTAAATAAGEETIGGSPTPLSP
jgi:DNA-binding GntR family transcriptional regulator